LDGGGVIDVMTNATLTQTAVINGPGLTKIGGGTLKLNNPGSGISGTAIVCPVLQPSRWRTGRARER
jgi:hypothetical protein